MSEYQENTSKPEKILTGYGTVRSAELKAIYSDIDMMTPLTQVENRFGRPTPSGRETDHIENCLRFLRTLDMIEQTAQDVLNPINTDLFATEQFPFELRLLYHIREQSGSQLHLADIQEKAIRSPYPDTGRYGIRRISVDDLRVAVERETDYDLEWRNEKIQMWANLLDPIGAISYSSSEDEILLAPSRKLVHYGLAYHQEHREASRSILSALEWINREFFTVFSRPGDTPSVHVGVADVLESLVADDALELVGMSDRSEEVDLPRQIDDTETPADYQVSTPPDRPAYWHPLERSERRLQP